jgi:hypothetical protein
MNGQLISVTWQGTISRDLLANSPKGTVVGVSSRGIFIRLDSGWVLFPSFERFHGPLTLNLFGELSALKGLEVNCAVEIQDRKIQIPSPGIEIDFSRAEAWEAPPRPESPLPAADRIRLLQTVAGLILSQKKEPGLYLVLQEMLDLKIGAVQSPPSAFERMDYWRLLQLLKTANPDEILSALKPLLGLGSGLTPAGDDMILGLLLAFGRWRMVLKPAFDLAGLNDLVIRAASQQTTLLSANLIACAAQGQADERLIRALDGLMTGSPGPEECARSLADWGNSSGGDALVGMALAILFASS